MNPKVSIVIPVYGNEAFLPKCISTLRAQTLRDIEFIFVCDGSPDNSLEILRRAEKMDSRIRVIAFEENQGVSAARNAGIDAAKGDYIGFCDGDDWVEPGRCTKRCTTRQKKRTPRFPSVGSLRTGAKSMRMFRSALTTA